jgi:hypothetical protein
VSAVERAEFELARARKAHAERLETLEYHRNMVKDSSVLIERLTTNLTLALKAQLEQERAS